MICLFSYLSFWAVAVGAFDVSWIPSDADGPLPLSEKFYFKLDKLCRVLESGDGDRAIPSDKRAVLVKMCDQLEEARRVRGGGGGGSGHGSQGWVLIILLACAGFYLWQKREVRSKWPVSTGRRLGQPQSRPPAGPQRGFAALGSRDEEVKKAREARLKRFT